MRTEDIGSIITAQREFFASGATLDVKWRKRLLIGLRASVVAHTDDIAKALEADLGKSATESYMCETGMLLSELSYLIRHIGRLAKPHRRRTPIAQFPAKSYEQPSPYGTVLIISPWNYPFLLSMEPLIEAVAAGNTVMLKTSRYSAATASVIQRIIGEVFDIEHVCAVTGGRNVNEYLMSVKFDYVFFTGGKTVGKLVYEKAAEKMTPVTLELGGKSPTIVDATADIKLAARRIVFGKLLNAGQTCVAPDYVYCDERIKDALVLELVREIERQYPAALTDGTYGKIITDSHFSRVVGLIDKTKVVCGGASDQKTRKIEPTVMDAVAFDDKVMGEEIFGPILPVLTFRTVDEAIAKINSMPEPLALYCFSSDKATQKSVVQRCRFGGGCINDVIIHLATTAMGFGGFGASGIGAYHGKRGFDTFTHYKSIVDKKTWLDLPMRYRPYSDKKTKWIKRFLK